MPELLEYEPRLETPKSENVELGSETVAVTAPSIDEVEGLLKAGADIVFCTEMMPYFEEPTDPYGMTGGWHYDNLKAFVFFKSKDLMEHSRFELEQNGFMVDQTQPSFYGFVKEIKGKNRESALVLNRLFPKVNFQSADIFSAKLKPDKEFI